MEEKREPRIHPGTYGQLISDKEAKMYNGGVSIVAQWLMNPTKLKVNRRKEVMKNSA